MFNWEGMMHDHAVNNSVNLADEPANHVTAYLAAFNSGSADVLDEIYEDDGLVVAQPGQPLTGADRLAANRHLLSFGLPINATTRHVYVAGDIALLIVDWSIHGTSHDGYDIHLQGTATDVARLGSDGKWRYVIDNPFGTAS